MYGVFPSLVHMGEEIPIPWWYVDPFRTLRLQGQSNGDPRAVVLKLQ